MKTEYTEQNIHNNQVFRDVVVWRWVKFPTLSG